MLALLCSYGGCNTSPKPAMALARASGRYLVRFRKLKWLAFLRALRSSAANALDADANSFDDPVYVHLNALQVRPKGPPSDAGRLTTHATQVLGLAFAGVLIAKDRFLTADRAMHAHGVLSFVRKRSFVENA